MTSFQLNLHLVVELMVCLMSVVVDDPKCKGLTLIALA